MVHSPRLTPEEYLALDRASDIRNEYYDGFVCAMAGGSIRHAIVLGKLFGVLHTALRKSPCIALPKDLRVRLSNQTYVYPDITVVCGEPRYGDDYKDVLLNPSLVIEILSPSTERHDRGLKSARYRELETLREYALVSQEEPRVEIFRRQKSGEWLPSESIGLEAECRFDGLLSEPVRIPLAEIYERVTFDASPAVS